MNPPASVSDNVSAYPHWSSRSLAIHLLSVLALVGGLAASGWCADVRAQQSPVSDPPAPVPTPAATPEVTVTPGLPAASDAADYRAARTPQANVTLAGGTPLAQTAQSRAAATGLNDDLGAPLTFAAVGGVFPTIDLASASGISAAGKQTSTTKASPARTAAAAALPPATVTLNFDPMRAGTVISVQMFDGGTLSAQNADGNTVTSQEGFLMEISPAGSVSFTFQAPDRPGRYQVAVRLDNITTVLPFVVPDPASGS